MVPEVHSTHGPGKINAGSVFFNEQMAFNRDVSVMLLRALQRPSMTVADAMTATGSRAVRIANEVPGTDVTANDFDENAIPYIEANIEINGLENCRASHSDMHCLFAENSYDYVDLDPFGSPSLFIQSAIRGCRKRAVLAVTATDTAPLAGAQTPKCRRRYQCEPIRGYMCHEGGLRILMCNIAREMGKFDMGMRPLLSFYADHYYRTYVEIVPGTKACDDMLAHLGYMRYDQKTLEMYAYIDGQLKDIRKTLCDQAVHNQRTEDSFVLVRQDVESVKSELSKDIKIEAERRCCGDNSIVTYANATFYPKMVADVTTGTGTTAQTLYNPLPKCGCDCCGK